MDVYLWWSSCNNYQYMLVTIEDMQADVWL